MHNQKGSIYIQKDAETYIKIADITKQSDSKQLYHAIARLHGESSPSRFESAVKRYISVEGTASKQISNNDEVLLRFRLSYDTTQDYYGIVHSIESYDFTYFQAIILVNKICTKTK